MEWLNSLRGASLAALVIKLVLAVIFGGVIGLERGRKRRPAGFRTHILVCMGATMAMCISRYCIDALGITTIIKDVTYNAQSNTWTIRDEYDRIISGENGAINLTSFSTASDLGAVKAVHVAGYWEYLEGIKPWNS